MRYVTVVIRRVDGFHPANQLLADEPTITRVAVQYIHILDDGTAVLLYHLQGDLARARDLLAAVPDILSVDVTGETDGVAYIHAQPIDSMATVLGIPERYEIVLELPIEHVDNGVRMTMVGHDKQLQQVLSEFPDDVHVDLERTGTYHPTTSQLSSLLTERQRDVLTIAVHEGYYDRPRRATQDDIADITGLSTATINEHLRKIEARVFTRIIE